MESRVATPTATPEGDVSDADAALNDDVGDDVWGLKALTPVPTTPTPPSLETPPKARPKSSHRSKLRLRLFTASISPGILGQNNTVMDKVNVGKKDVKETVLREGREGERERGT